MVDRRHVLTSRSRASERKNSERRLWAHLNDDWIHVFVEFVMRKNPSTSHSIHRLWCSGFPKSTERNEWKKSTAFKSHFILFREVPHWIGSFISNTVLFSLFQSINPCSKTFHFGMFFPFLFYSSLRWHKSSPKPNGILQCFDEILWRLKTIQRHNIWWRDTYNPIQLAVMRSNEPIQTIFICATGDGNESRFNGFSNRTKYKPFFWR